MVFNLIKWDPDSTMGSNTKSGDPHPKSGEEPTNKRNEMTDDNKHG